MKKLGLKTGVLILLSSSIACFVPRAEGDQMLVDISRLRSDLAATQRDEGDRHMLMDSRLKKLEAAVFKQSADISLEKDRLLTEVEQLKTQLQEIQSVKPVEPVAVPAPASLSKTDQIAAIKTAYESKEYERAISGCDAFLNKYLDDKQFSAQVLFWRGDSYYELGEFKKSVLSFQDLLTRFQTFSKVPEALYKVGLSLDTLKFPKDATVFYEEIIKKYPKSSFAGKAKEQLKKKKK